jgi:hypothetical protein
MVHIYRMFNVKKWFSVSPFYTFNYRINIGYIANQKISHYLVGFLHRDNDSTIALH